MHQTNDLMIKWTSRIPKCGSHSKLHSRTSTREYQNYHVVDFIFLICSYIFIHFLDTAKHLYVFGPQKSQRSQEVDSPRSQASSEMELSPALAASLVQEWGIIPGGHTEVPSSRVATDTKKQSMSLAELGHVGSFRIHQLWVVHLKSLLPFSSPMMYNDVYWCLLYTVLKWSTHVYPLYPSVYSNMRWEIQKNNAPWRLTSHQPKGQMSPQCRSILRPQWSQLLRTAKPPSPAGIVINIRRNRYRFIRYMVNKNVEKRKHQEIFINLNKSMYFTASKQLKPPTFDDFSVVESFFFPHLPQLFRVFLRHLTWSRWGGLVPKLTSSLGYNWLGAWEDLPFKVETKLETCSKPWSLHGFYHGFYMVFVIDGCPAICVPCVMKGWAAPGMTWDPPAPARQHSKRSRQVPRKCSPCFHASRPRWIYGKIYSWKEILRSWFYHGLPWFTYMFTCHKCWGGDL